MKKLKNLVYPVDVTPEDIEAIKRLEAYGSWRLQRFTQPFDNGKVLDKLYVCALRTEDGNWTADEYGGDIASAADRAIENKERLKDEKHHKT